MRTWAQDGLRAQISEDTHFTLYTPHGVNFRGTDLMVTAECCHCGSWLGTDGGESCPCGLTTLPPHLTALMTWASAGEWLEAFLSARQGPLEATLTGAAFADTMASLHGELKAMARNSVRKRMEQSVRTATSVRVDH